MHIDIKFLFSGTAIAVSIIAITVSYLSARKSRVIGLRPVLVFCFNTGSGWSVKNIGNGPALNTVLALLDADDRWISPEGIPSLGVNGEFVFGGFNTQIGIVGWGCLYTDISERPYSTIHKGNKTQIVKGSIFPAWNSDEISMKEK
ncbi:4-hydroxybenzoate polyprenyltransferase and related prenyltransferase [Candidatus Scalindua japonica]|uniref:4-hydroxybenzoate polyprenyltransferase and related prenyltransferase n=1 Tax=Candidatus Scalindua japonica TaxID=1284222 RepID=A0A286TVM8_9BACT|nr:hypothetical protein [Candidatus Scalindua japonica]GAX59957.1 4-hydroxybenzoate polyprenyltransferase and related prenyltransferase [Candidatus Scalindua japonica]